MHSQVRRIVGVVDEPKVLSSVNYFLRISDEIGDLGVNRACRNLLEYINDPSTEKSKKDNNTKSPKSPKTQDRQKVFKTKLEEQF